VLSLPIRCRSLSEHSHLYVNDSGRFFSTTQEFTSRLVEEGLTSADKQWLRHEAHLIDNTDEFEMDAHAYAIAERLTRPGPLDYLILVPTLRCNLSCSYCQVSRVDEHHTGYDWSDQTLSAVLEFIDGLESPTIKIEFQGGEPTLRPDLIQRVIDRCARFEDAQFVICSNLQQISPGALAIFDREDVFISTSLDGDFATHDRQRTAGQGSHFVTNLNQLTSRYRPGKIHALPTVDPDRPPDADGLIDAFMSYGLNSIFLRPINYQGFARKRHQTSREQGAEWQSYYEAFVRNLIARNWANRSELLEETYFSICLRRIFQPGRERHVDLRNPNPAGEDYILIDYDGSLYPTDEARMLTRSGVVDLKLGRVGEDWRGDTWRLLNEAATNQFDPACERCAYQPFCGRDLIDDLSRYGRIDLKRTETEFCRKHLHIFDFIFSLIYDPEPAVQYSLRRWLGVRDETLLGKRLV
jgi:His-Xaa-Ser system radical SAM maturase HxsB